MYEQVIKGYDLRALRIIAQRKFSINCKQGNKLRGELIWTSCELISSYHYG